MKISRTEQMKCTVYRSNKKDLTYLYLPSGVEDFDGVPQELLKMIQPLEQVLEFELTEDRPLASEDPKAVLEQLNDQGWYLQYPTEEQRRALY